MSTLIEEVADSFCNLVALNDITTIPIIHSRRDVQDYDFFIETCEEYVRYFNDLLILKRERYDERKE